MSRAGVRRAIGVLAAAQRSYSGCLQYKENVRDARVALRERGARDVEVIYVGDWHEHPGFIEANADHVRQAFDRLPADARDVARLIFTAHSIPTTMARAYPVRGAAPALGASASRRRAGRTDWALVYQSRSGRPGDPWLEPDVCDYLAASARTADAAVLCPVGFLCDHVRSALRPRRRSGRHVPRSWASRWSAPRRSTRIPRFIDALADAVADT